MKLEILNDPIMINNILVNFIKSFRKNQLEKNEILDENEKLL